MGAAEARPDGAAARSSSGDPAQNKQDGAGRGAYQSDPGGRATAVIKVGTQLSERDDRLLFSSTHTIGQEAAFGARPGLILKWPLLSNYCRSPYWHIHLLFSTQNIGHVRLYVPVAWRSLKRPIGRPVRFQPCPGPNSSCQDVACSMICMIRAASCSQNASVSNEEGLWAGRIIANENSTSGSNRRNARTPALSRYRR